MQTITTNYVSVKQHSRNFLLTSMQAGVIGAISYAAQRGISNEPGAVQRILNPNRISSIKKFTIENGDYPGAIVLNWVSSENILVKSNGTVSFGMVQRSAQIIDGQHRLAGIRAAIEEDESIYNMELPVAIYENLTTKQCADIFLSINTEQKPVPRSLVFDLYGIASEPLIDQASVRARDIAAFLNDEKDSPYHENIKFPGDPKRKGGIALSTAVTALKPLVEEKGYFEQIGITELHLQQVIIMNFFKALQEKYGKNWNSPKNAFQYASGFVGAIDFFKTRLLSYCSQIGKFKVDTITALIDLGPDDLILQDEVKGLGGKEAPRNIARRLVDAFEPSRNQSNNFEV